MKNIDMLFTQKINEYLEKGYLFNAGTMGGSQGEMSRVDLTDGKEIIRIFIKQCSDHPYIPGVKIIVGRCRDSVSPHTPAVIWTSHLEILEEQSFYEIGFNYFGTLEDALAAYEKRRERTEIKNSWVNVTTPERVQVVIPMIRRHLGIKNINPKNVLIFRNMTGKGDLFSVRYDR